MEYKEEIHAIFSIGKKRNEFIDEFVSLKEKMNSSMSLLSFLSYLRDNKQKIEFIKSIVSIKHLFPYSQIPTHILEYDKRADFWMYLGERYLGEMYICIPITYTEYKRLISETARGEFLSMTLGILDTDSIEKIF